MTTLGKTKTAAMPIDLQRLLETRLLIQANSGGGKSWALRRILEQTARDVQQLVIDPEGEFATLREHFDYVICAPRDADAVATPQTAALLARRLLESGVSAILDIYDLKAHERQLFVQRFLEALINAPKSLWHPVVVVLDEAHVFAPQAGGADAIGAVIDLATRGRKRGQCLICATQRLSKLHKDVAAELLNKLIGRTGLDVDVKRAADELGMTAKDAVDKLRRLEPGQFFAFGPALSASVEAVTVGPVQTTHPKSGQRMMKAPPSASQKILATLAKLADLPAQAAGEIHDLESARKRIADLEREVKAKPVAASPEPVIVEKPVLSDEFLTRLENILTDTRKSSADLALLSDEFMVAARQVRSTPNSAPNRLPSPAGNNNRNNLRTNQPSPGVHKTPGSVNQTSRNGNKSAPSVNKSAASGDSPHLGKAERAILRACYWLDGDVPTKQKIAFYSDYSSKSSGLDKALSNLRTAGLIAGFAITHAGVAAVGDVPQRPRGLELREWLRPKLGQAENALLDAMIEAYPQRLSKADVAARSGYSDRSSGVDKALSNLRTIEAAEGLERDGGTKAADVFFE